MSEATKRLATDSTLSATNNALGNLAKDATLSATNTALANLAKDSTLSASNTALTAIKNAIAALPNATQAAADAATAAAADVEEALSTLDTSIAKTYDQVGKRLRLCNYTFGDGVLQTTTGEYNTSETMYKHLSCPATAGVAYLVGGYNYGATFSTANFLDSNGDIVGHSPSISASQGWQGWIIAPADTATMVVNIRMDGGYARTIYIYTYDTQETQAAEVSVNTVDMGGKITFDYAFNVTTGQAVSQPENTYLFKEVTLSGGERLIITGWNGSANYPFYTFFDANDNCILNIYNTTACAVYNYSVVAPTTARKILVHGRLDRSIIPVIQKVTSENAIKNMMETVNADTCEAVADLESIYPTYNYTKVVKTKKLTDSATNDVYLYCTASVTPGNTYYITGWNYSMNYPVYNFADSNGNPCGQPQIGTMPANGQVVNCKVQAPQDAVMVYVNGRVGGDCDIKVAGVNSIRTALKVADASNVYTGRTPVADLISTSAKAEQNLARFSMAFGVMLHRIMTTYPLALVVCCDISECERTVSIGTGFPETNKAGETIADYNMVIERLCRAFGAVYVPHHDCGITYYNFSNYVVDYDPQTGAGLHPNAAGMKLLSDKTINTLEGYDLANKKLVVYGDSISTYNGTGSTIKNMYPYGDVNSVEKMWWHLSMIQHFNMTLLTNASAGSRSVSTIREGLTGYPKSGVNQDSVDSIQPGATAPDVILIKMGTNDFGNAGSTTNLDLNGHYHYGGI